MKKKPVIIAITAIMILGIGTTCMAASSTDIITSVKSKNTLKYQGADGDVALYSSDIILLARKLSTIPDRPFDPGIYTHIHAWEYINVNDDTHTKHCPECGSENDITNTHVAIQRDACDINYGGNTYTLCKCTCECGHQWMEENSHNLAYESVSDTKHSISCALDGTEYCSGYRSYNENHSLGQIPDDNTHHTVKCSLCDYETTEECDFTDYSEVNEEGSEITWYCQCGNSKTEPYSDTNATTTASALSNDLDINEGSVNTDTTNQQNEANNSSSTTQQTAVVASYISNNDGTHQVLSGTEVINASEPCSLTVDPDTYNEVTGKATYECNLCNYSMEDDYEPVTGE